MESLLSGAMVPHVSNAEQDRRSPDPKNSGPSRHGPHQCNCFVTTTTRAATTAPMSVTSAIVLVSRGRKKIQPSTSAAAAATRRTSAFPDAATSRNATAASDAKASDDLWLAMLFPL